MPPGKREIYQHDINVPLLVSGPGIQAGRTIRSMAANYDLAITWATLAGVTPAVDAPAIDGKSLVPMLLGSDTPIRTFTLQEGYQSCEAGHGEGRACSRRGPEPKPPSGPPAPPTPFHCSGSTGKFCTHQHSKCLEGRSFHMGPEMLAQCESLCIANQTCNCVEFTPHPHGPGAQRCKLYSGARGVQPFQAHDVYIPAGRDHSAPTVGTQQTCKTFFPKCIVDYSGLRFKNHSIQEFGSTLDAMYVEYEDGGRSYYDTELDPWQTKNIYSGLSAQQKAALHRVLVSVVNCSGAMCP